MIIYVTKIVALSRIFVHHRYVDVERCFPKLIRCGILSASAAELMSSRSPGVYLGHALCDHIRSSL